MKKKIILLFFFICFVKVVIGQERVSILGKVQDSLLKPLEFSNIIIYKQNTSNIFDYAISNEKGEFKIEIFKDSLYTLKASYVGFDNYQVNFKAIKNNYKLITLKESNNNLGEVQVVYNLPIKISGDTISYKVDAFTNGRERKLKDIIKKLPGFDIDEDGNVKVQGKKVNKIMVNGKDFFSGDTKLATKNIPANVVDKVNILKNFNDVQPLKDLESSENYAIDIRLKDGEKNIMFGSLEGGLGIKQRYKGHANMFYYNPKISVNFIGDINNIGEEAFTFQDYFKFNGGFKNMGVKSSFNLSSDLLGFTNFQENKVKNSISKLGALNFSYNPNNELSFTGFLIHSEINYDIQSNSKKTYINEDKNSIEKLNSNIYQESTSDLIKVSSKYIPNNKLHLQYDALLDAAKLFEESNQISYFQSNVKRLKSTSTNKPLSFQQKFGLYFSQNEKNIYSFDLSYQYKNKKNPFNLFTQERPFVTLIPFIDSPNYNINQNIIIKTNSFKSIINYYYIINNTNHINFFSGTDYSCQNFNSNISQIKNGKQIDIINRDFQNDTKYSYLDSYLGFNYRTKLRKLIIDSGLAFHTYNSENKDKNLGYEFKISKLLPSFRFKYNFRKARILSLSYNIKPEFYDIQKLASGLIITDYNTVFKGNIELENSLYHNFNLDYYDFNGYNFSNLYAVLSYQIKNDDIGNIITYNNTNSVITLTNVKTPKKILSCYFNYDKRFKKVNINASANLSLVKYNNFLENLLINNQSFTQDYTVSFETKMDNFPILELGFEKKINSYKSDALNKQLNNINTPFANIEVSFLKHFILLADYKYTFYNIESNDTSSKYDILNAFLYYKQDDNNFEIKLSFLNLLNSTSIRKDSFTNNYLNFSEYKIQPQYFLISAIYNF